MQHSRGMTLIEWLTLLVALAVVAAVAIPVWRSHQLNTRRALAIQVLSAVQKAQDRHFGSQAHYADPAQLKVTLAAPAYRFAVEVSPDGLSYVASATAVGDGTPDSVDARCTHLRLDQHGRRSATSSAGDDTTLECWGKD